jgi:addiction module HigA family antidote
MIPENRVPVHPGVILLEEFLLPLGITQVELARHLDVPVQRINEIVNGKRGVTPTTAWMLSETFESTPEFWLNLQRNRDLALHRPEMPIKSLKTVAR